MLKSTYSAAPTTLLINAKSVISQACASLLVLATQRAGQVLRQNVQVSKEHRFHF